MRYHAKWTGKPIDIASRGMAAFRRTGSMTGTVETDEPMKPFVVSRRTLKIMDSSMANLKKGLVSAPVDLSAFSPRKKK